MRAVWLWMRRGGGWCRVREDSTLSRSNTLRRRREEKDDYNTHCRTRMEVYIKELT